MPVISYWRRRTLSAVIRWSAEGFLRAGRRRYMGSELARARRRRDEPDRDEDHDHQPGNAEQLFAKLEGAEYVHGT